MSKTYDRAYFERWYRGSRAVADGADVLRSARLAVGAAEYLLQRPIRNVLDVGCGEAPWRAALRRVRPGVHYLGLDPSEYAVARWGRRRNIRRAAFADLAKMTRLARYDLIVCADVLHYLPAADVRAGLAGVVRLLRGVAYLQLFTRDDDFVGDMQDFRPRSAAWYRRTFRAAGLVELGLNCWTTRAIADEHAAALERR